MTAGSGHFHTFPDIPAAAAIRRSRASHSAEPMSSDYQMKQIAIQKLEKELERKSTIMVANLLNIWELRAEGVRAAQESSEDVKPRDEEIKDRIPDEVSAGQSTLKACCACGGIAWPIPSCRYCQGGLATSRAS